MWALELEGKKFNNLYVLRKIRTTRKGESFWECLCDCGNKKEYSSDHLTRKKNNILWNELNLLVKKVELCSDRIRLDLTSAKEALKNNDNL